jgi:hypothetical protein
LAKPAASHRRIVGQGIMKEALNDSDNLFIAVIAQTL